MHIFDMIQTFISGSFAFVVLLGLLIFVHEFGHFAVARWCGVRVETFSLGFGKKIWKRKKGDTTYCISAIPFGGYVKMFGDQPGVEVSEEDKKYSFTHKKVWERMAIVLAGPLVNFFFAIFIFMVLAMSGEDIPPSRLGDIDTTSKAYQMGFRSGDLITEIDGEKTQTIEQLHQIMNDKIGKKTQFKVVRETGEATSFEAQIEKEENKNPLISEKFIGNIDGFQFYSKGNYVGVTGDTPLYTIGLRPGDRIVAVNQTAVRNWRSLSQEFEKLTAGSQVQLEVERLNEKSKKTEKLSLNFQAPSSVQGPITLASLKIESAEVFLNLIVEKSPAQLAGLQPGDRIKSINAVPVTKWEDVLNSVKGFQGDAPLKLEVIRGIDLLTLDVLPKMTSQTTALGSEDKRYTIGISPFPNVVSEEPVKFSIGNPFAALARGTSRTFESTGMILVNLARLVKGEISSKNIGGIISIGQAAHESFKRGISYYLHLMAILSVNLFILNLLPIPVLDGGHFVFYTIEAIKGSPLSLRKMEFAQQIGMALLLMLMVYALYNDVTKFLPL
jgi:regulator of sigma E protease